MTKKLKFYGASDDLFEIEGTSLGEPDEIGCYSRTPIVKVCNDLAGLQVIAHYVGVWSIGIAPLDEDIPLPGWPMEWRLSGLGYSTELTLEVPDDVRVSEVEP